MMKRKAAQCLPLNQVAKKELEAEEKDVEKEKTGKSLRNPLLL